jgi:hypothetical protein
MNSPRLNKKDEFETVIAQDLKAWSARVQAPESSRQALLEAAARQERRSMRRLPALKSLVPQGLQRWLTAPLSRAPKLPQSELAQWLFTQAMWHNLGNDRRAVRFVC